MNRVGYACYGFRVFREGCQSTLTKCVQATEQEAHRASTALKAIETQSVGRIGVAPPTPLYPVQAQSCLCNRVILRQSIFRSGEGPLRCEPLVMQSSQRDKRLAL